MKEMFYAEVIADYHCDNECGQRYKAADCYGSNWKDNKDTLYKWSKYINFEHIGISGGEPMNNIKIKDWIYGIREVLPKTNIVFITNGIRLLKDNTLIKDMIDVAPSKLCIVLPNEWQSFLQEFKKILEQIDYRFIRKGNEPVKGVDYILLSRDIKFDIELYHHVDTNPKHDANRLSLLNATVEENLFRYCHNRKSMPILEHERIFKCRNAYRLWNYWNDRKDAIQYPSDIVEKYKEIIKDSVISDISHLNLLDDLYKKSKICDFCSGCVECVVYPKNKISKLNEEVKDVE